MACISLHTGMAACDRLDEREAAPEPAAATRPITQSAPAGAPVAPVSPAGGGAAAPERATSAPAPAASAATDSGAVLPTPLELTELAAVLDMPLAGIAPTQLLDTFGESRGDHVHEAIDIAAPRGTPVRSAADGRLLRLFNSRAGGLMVYAADPSERFILLYGHLDRFADGLVEGTPLKRGQVIGYVGTTGNAPAGTPHLHFAILRGRPATSWSSGTPVNPYPLLTARKAPQ